MARERTDMRKSRKILRHIILQLKLSYQVVVESLGAWPLATLLYGPTTMTFFSRTPSLPRDL